MTTEPEAERRASKRSAASFEASMRLPGKIARSISVLDLSVEGCSIEPAAFLAVGQIVWVRLPGLESWETSVAWVKEGHAGLKFKKTLHSAVVASLVERQQSRSSASFISPKKIDPPINVRARLRAKGSGSL